MFPLVLLGSLFAFPSKYVQKLKALRSKKSELIVEYVKMEKKFIRVQIFGFVLFVLISLFLCAYIIAFSHEAKHGTSN